MHRELLDARRRANTHAFFQNKPADDNTVSTYRRSKPNRRWTPPDDPRTALQFRRARETFCTLADRQEAPHKKGDWLVKRARRWLENNPDFLIADSDKNLGDLIIHRSALQQITQDQLRRGFKRIDAHEASEIVHNTNMALEQIAVRHHRAGNIKRQQCDFLLEATSKRAMGRFRVRVKLHKTPISGRPLCNMAGCSVQMIGVFLHETLYPTLSRHTSIINSTDDLIRQMSSWRIPCGYKIRTTDVVDMFPSLDRVLLMPRLKKFYHENLADGIAQLLTSLTDLILRGTTLQHGDSFWLCTEGVPTGLSPSSTIANAALISLDEELVKTHDILHLRRYIDDIITVDKAEEHDFSATASKWMSSIKLEQSGSACMPSDEVVYLDLRISFDSNGAVLFTQYEKPLAQYLYIPWGSSHSTGLKTGLITSGLIRIGRRFSIGQPASLIRAAQERFFNRLRNRGYPNHVLRQAMQRFRKSGHTGPIARVSSHPKTRPLVIALRRNTSARVQRKTPTTMFLRNFRRTWPKRQPEKTDGRDGGSRNFFGCHG